MAMRRELTTRGLTRQVVHGRPAVPAERSRRAVGRPGPVEMWVTAGLLQTHCVDQQEAVHCLL